MYDMPWLNVQDGGDSGQAHNISLLHLTGEMDLLLHGAGEADSHP